MEKEKAINKTISLYPEQIKRVSKVVDINRHGQFSQFVQDSIDERLERLGVGKVESEFEKQAS